MLILISIYFHNATYLSYFEENLKNIWKKNDHIFFHSELPYFQALNDTRTAKAVEVVIGSEARLIGNQLVQNIYSDMENEMISYLEQTSFNQ